MGTYKIKYEDTKENIRFEWQNIVVDSFPFES